MTARQIYDFSVGQIAWYEKQNDYIVKFLAFCNNELARSRSRDKEIAEYALSTEPDNPLTVRIFGGHYVSSETQKLLNERARYYRERKRNNERIAHYTKERDYWERFIG